MKNSTFDPGGQQKETTAFIHHGYQFLFTTEEEVHLVENSGYRQAEG